MGYFTDFQMYKNQNDELPSSWQKHNIDIFNSGELLLPHSHRQDGKWRSNLHFEGNVSA